MSRTCSGNEFVEPVLVSLSHIAAFVFSRVLETEGARDGDAPRRDGDGREKIRKAPGINWRAAKSPS
jgi:hypothetical protein